MKFYTIKDIAEMVGEHNIFKAENRNAWVTITLMNGIKIKIRSF